MNLNLEQKSGAHILKISGDVDVKGTAILRAGVTKLMKSGKDKIILDLAQVGGLHESFVKEVTELHKLAAELMGKVVVAGAPANVATQLKAAGDPPPFPVINTVIEAITFLQQTGQLIEELPPEIDALIKQRDARIQALENQIALSNPEELRKLRQENETLRSQTQALESQVTELIQGRRIPPDVEAVLEKINVLERNVKEMSASLQAGGNAKK